MTRRPFQPRLLGDEQRKQPRPFEILDDDKLLPVAGRAEFERLHDVRMLDRHADLPFARLLQAFEAVFVGGRFRRIEDLQADDLPRLPIASHIEARHRPRDRLAEQLEPLGEIDLRGEQRFEISQEAHVRSRSPYDGAARINPRFRKPAVRHE